jgi:hypothetical protein
LGQAGDPLAGTNHDLVMDSAKDIPGRSRIPQSAKDLDDCERSHVEEEPALKYSANELVAACLHVFKKRSW